MSPVIHNEGASGGSGGAPITRPRSHGIGRSKYILLAIAIIAAMALGFGLAG